MMNKKGQLDQIITSIIIVVAAVFLSGVFIVISSNIAQIAGVESKSSDAPIYTNNGISRAVLDVFLADDVLVKGKSMKVSEAVTHFTDADGLDYAVAVEGLFKERYSCNNMNAMGISKSHTFTPGNSKTDSDNVVSKISWYIDYPSVPVSSSTFGNVKVVSDASNKPIPPSSFTSFNGASAAAVLTDLNVQVLAQEAPCVH